MILYTAGFLFSENRDNVVLIRKNRPEWQSGKLNAIGGHIEENENSLSCIKREFKEETSLDVCNWELFVTLTNYTDWTVFFFRSFLTFSELLKCKSMTDEEVKIYDISVRELPSNMIDNLYWLIPLALSKDSGIPFYILENITQQ